MSYFLFIYLVASRQPVACFQWTRLWTQHQESQNFPLYWRNKDRSHTVVFLGSSLKPLTVEEESWTHLQPSLFHWLLSQMFLPRRWAWSHLHLEFHVMKLNSSCNEIHWGLTCSGYHISRLLLLQIWSLPDFQIHPVPGHCPEFQVTQPFWVN